MTSQQLQLFDLPAEPVAGQEAPGRAEKPRATKDTTPAPRGVPAPAVASQGGQDKAARLAELRSDHEAWLSRARAGYAELCERCPAPALPAETVARLSDRGITYRGSYRLGTGDVASLAEAGQPIHVLEAQWRPAHPGRSILPKSDPGVAALLDGEILPADLVRAGMHRGPGGLVELPGEDPGDAALTFAFPTFARNVEAAREFLAARARREAEEAARTAQQARKGKRRA